ncbi:MAG TPA: tetratricopeptide repeat protein [Candidatus Acidoferrum sp.]|nr:tetratricopeptide repeat protein [Candidatus Acidoferrum sp.]
MKRLWKTGAWAAAIAATLFFWAAPGAWAQGGGSITGTIYDVVGKPWYNVPMQCVSDQGQKQETKTAADGTYSFRNLRPGIYHVYIVLPAPNKPYDLQVQVGSDSESKADLNFKDVVAKQGAAAQEEVKKQAEDKAKFESMKQHFDAGNQLLAEERKVKDQLGKSPTDQRDALKQNLKDLSDKAVAEFQEAQKAEPEKDSNRHLLWATLGEAYDVAGRNDEAAEAYQQAIKAKPDDPGYYNNLGNVLARAGKIDDARAAYTKSAELDPTKAAVAWRNFGISLYNANRLSDAVEPLQKAVQLDPKNAQSWYLLGASLVSQMTTKKVGDKEEVQFAPGTVEAYQKALDLDPNGPYGQQAKEGLAMLQQLAPGIETKVNVRKKKS